MKRTGGAGLVFLVLVSAACVPALAAESVTVGQAGEIALSQAGNAGVIVDTDIDYGPGGGFVYEFEIVDGGVKYEIEIDGSTGGVLEFSREDGRSRGITPARRGLAGTPPDAGARMTADAARELALKTAGGGSVTRYKLDRDDGRYVHEVTVFRDDKRYKFEIDDGDGAIGELSVKRRNG